MGSKSNILALLLVVSCLTCILLPHAAVQAQTRTLIVPDQYPTIQAALDNAGAGDTVYVRNGTYAVGEIVINNPLSLIGENASTTIIDQQALPLGVRLELKLTMSPFRVLQSKTMILEFL